MRLIQQLLLISLENRFENCDDLTAMLSLVVFVDGNGGAYDTKSIGGTFCMSSILCQEVVMIVSFVYLKKQLNLAYIPCPFFSFFHKISRQQLYFSDKDNKSLEVLKSTILYSSINNYSIF